MGVVKMLLVAMMLWSIFAIMSHGLSILIYMGIQAVTSGLFVCLFNHVEKSYANS